MAHAASLMFALIGLWPNCYVDLSRIRTSISNMDKCVQVNKTTLKTPAWASQRSDRIATNNNWNHTINQSNTHALTCSWHLINVRFVSWQLADISQMSAKSADIILTLWISAGCQHSLLTFSRYQPNVSWHVRLMLFVNVCGAVVVCVVGIIIRCLWMLSFVFSCVCNVMLVLLTIQTWVVITHCSCSCITIGLKVSNWQQP